MKTLLRQWVALPLIGGTLFVIASCATDGFVRSEGERTTESAYGNYLAARFASGMNDVNAAAKYYAAALNKEPENELLRQQAFLSALIAGDIPQSAGFARPVLGTETEERLMRLDVAAFDIGNRRYDRALDTLATGEYGPFNHEVRQLLRGWAAFGAGDIDLALEQIDEAGQAPLFARIVQLNKAMLLDLSGRTTDAEIAYKAAMKSILLSDRAAYAFGTFLQRQGRIVEARNTYTKAIAVFTEAPLSRLALSRLETETTNKTSGKALKRLVNNASEGAAEALFGTAQVLGAQAHFDKALVYLEMARFINPRQDAAKQLLGRLMEVQSRPEDALAMFATIGQKSAYKPDADLNRARVLFRMDRRDEAVKIFRTLAEAHPEDKRLVGAYADVLRSIRQYEQALPIYNRLMTELGDKADWQTYFARGTVLERLGRWPESIKDFRKSLALNPDQPDVLNYLGYTYINAGENLDEGFELIERALSLRPDAGYIVDSLGWAHYRLGQYEQAVRYLERAVEMAPGEATISDHLADAYWQAGRRLEARFQWKHTLSLKPDDDIDLQEVEEKLVHGLRDQPEIANANP